MSNNVKLSADLKMNKGGVLLFDTDNFTPPLEMNKKYTLDIKPYKSSRSLDQNKLMWSIIQQIAKVTGNDEMSIYMAGLEYANVKYEFILALPESENALRHVFRAVKIASSTRTINDKEMLVCKCYIGSSKFDTAEMTKLIDYFIKEAAELGIYIQKL